MASDTPRPLRYAILVVLVDNKNYKAGLLFATAWKRHGLSAEFMASTREERVHISVEKTTQLLSALTIEVDTDVGVFYARQTGNDDKLRAVVIAGVRNLDSLYKIFMPIRVPFPVLRDENSITDIIKVIQKM